ncbi:MAG: PQQ-binding-like beta-propeller repeat protein [bacterium]
MTATMPPAESPSPAALRVWPGAVAVALHWLGRFVLPILAPEVVPPVLASTVTAAGVFVWWVFLSRAAWADRVGALVWMLVAMFAASLVAHDSVAHAILGIVFRLYGVPVLSLALVVAALLTRHRGLRARRAAMLIAIGLASSLFTLVRSEGVTGDAATDFHWRWTRTPEERLLARSGGGPALDPPAAGVRSREALAESTPSDHREWPGFRGPKRDSVVRGVAIAVDWTRSPPVERWRRPIGPGWSSFAVRGEALFTQEQQGDDELVSSYALATGAPLWSHRDATRFTDPNGGVGPRATPAVVDGRVFALGATGILNALDAVDGSVVWSRNVTADTQTEVPDHGFAGSPLVVDDSVIVAAAGVLASYDRDTGRPRWVTPTGGWGFSSPLVATIDGVTQLLLANSKGVTGIAFAHGARLWDYAWAGDGIVQPVVLANGDVLVGSADGLGSGSGVGIRRVAVTRTAGRWSATERWKSVDLKPYFNGFVVHRDHAFGFDGTILACIDLADGRRNWKGGRFGYGQVILLADQDVLLVMSDRGELALVAASIDRFRELARFQVLEGRTWNHPVLAGDVLLARNDHEMVAFRMPPASASEDPRGATAETSSAAAPEARQAGE